MCAVPSGKSKALIPLCSLTSTASEGISSSLNSRSHVTQTNDFWFCITIPPLASLTRDRLARAADRSGESRRLRRLYLRGLFLRLTSRYARYTRYIRENLSQGKCRLSKCLHGVADRPEAVRYPRL